MLKVVLGFLMLVGIVETAHAACDIQVRSKSYQRYYQGTYYDVIRVPKSSLADLSTSRQYNYAAHFKNKVQVQTKTEHEFLLNRQKPFFKNLAEDSERAEKVLNKKIGRARKSSCLENFLLDNHLRTFSAETEFSAYVLTKFNFAEALVVVYTQINNAPLAETITANLVETYRKQEWNVESRIHNRPFFFKNPSGNIGGSIMPSNSEISIFREQGHSFRLRSGIVTNGFESFVLYGSEFDRF